METYKARNMGPQMEQWRKMGEDMRKEYQDKAKDMKKSSDEMREQAEKMAKQFKEQGRRSKKTSRDEIDSSCYYPLMLACLASGRACKHLILNEFGMHYD
jgi:hypothetical protein